MLVKLLLLAVLANLLIVDSVLLLHFNESRRKRRNFTKALTFSFYGSICQFFTV